MDDSPLGKLAAELRNKIYEHVLIHDKPIHVNMMHDGLYRPIRMRLVDQKFNRRPTALLAVCRQTQGECTELFYANNHFRLGLTAINRGISHNITVLGYFMSAIGVSNRYHLRHITAGIMGEPQKHQDSIEVGAVEHGLFKQLRHIERCALRNPHIRVECFIGIKCYKNSVLMRATLEDMSDWYKSKHAAKKALGTFKKSDPDGKLDNRISIARATSADPRHLTRVLDLYVSAKEPWPYDYDTIPQHLQAHVVFYISQWSVIIHTQHPNQAPSALHENQLDVDLPSTACLHSPELAFELF
ncbi:hypothetical protein BST61_g3216 [Cercospora zeina]